MAKATFGFKASEWNEIEATKDAIRRATEDETGILNGYKGSYETEKVQTDEQRHNDEFCIVIRTPDEV